jgi:hypothetical protein
MQYIVIYGRKYLIIKYNHYDSYVVFLIQVRMFLLTRYFELYKDIVTFQVMSYELSRRMLEKYR